jgi:hypothetical protein
MYMYLYLLSALLECYTLRNTLFDLTWLPSQYRHRYRGYVTEVMLPGLRQRPALCIHKR